MFPFNLLAKRRHYKQNVNCKISLFKFDEYLSYRTTKCISKGNRLMHAHGKITPQKMKFSIEDFFSKCDQIRRKLRIWSHLLKKSSMENFISSPANSGYLENAGERQYCTDCIVKCIAELQIWAKVLLLMVLCRKTFWTLETSVTTGGDGIWNSWVQKP